MAKKDKEVIKEDKVLIEEDKILSEEEVNELNDDEIGIVEADEVEIIAPSAVELTVKVAFTDKYTNKSYRVDDIISVASERASELLSDPRKLVIKK